MSATTAADQIREALIDAARPGMARYIYPEAWQALEELVADSRLWLAWSDGQYPDESRGEVIAASADGAIVLDDGGTTWNPLRAAEFLAAEVARLRQAS